MACKMQVKGNSNIRLTGRCTMFYFPDMLIYLWLLPMIMLLIFPLFWSVTGLLYRFLERSTLGGTKGSFEAHLLNNSEVDREKRKEERISIKGIKTYLAEENLCCTASVLNISKEGACFRNLPHQMYTADKFRILFRTRRQDHLIDIQPRWVRTHSGNNLLGGEITRSKTGWKNLIDSMNPKGDSL